MTVEQIFSTSELFQWAFPVRRMPRSVHGLKVYFNKIQGVTLSTPTLALRINPVIKQLLYSYITDHFIYCHQPQVTSVPLRLTLAPCPY